eukprot:3565061-Amphidinium_carterae.1
MGRGTGGIIGVTGHFGDKKQKSNIRRSLIDTIQSSMDRKCQSACALLAADLHALNITVML